MRLGAALVVGGMLSICAHRDLLAQVRGAPPPTPQRRDTVRPRPDSTRRDTTAADSTRMPKELIKWNEPDSVMKELMARQGYTATRYQSQRAVFNAQTRTLNLQGEKSTKAAVNREQTVLVGDSIVYNDSTKIIVARGDTVTLRDPQQQTADVIARGQMAYNVELHRGIVTNIATQIAETGQQWFVGGKTAAFVSDTTRGRETAFYVRSGSITSCDDSIPDYHFRANEIKMVSKHIMVARPAILYIGDVPVMWLPFIFQDMRSGRRSGMLTPRFGISELFRKSELSPSPGEPRLLFRDQRLHGRAIRARLAQWEQTYGGRSRLDPPQRRDAVSLARPFHERPFGALPTEPARRLVKHRAQLGTQSEFFAEHSAHGEHQLRVQHLRAAANDFQSGAGAGWV